MRERRGWGWGEGGGGKGERHICAQVCACERNLSI